MAPRTVAAIPADVFASPLVYRDSLPLRVAVYGGIAGAVRDGRLPPGALLPPEADLGAAFQVSRTVMREALILLEEDGLLRTQRGVGRFVADVVPEFGVEVLQPIERMLTSTDKAVNVGRVKSVVEPATDFTSRWLGVGRDTRCRMWESIVSHDAEPVALAQEWVAELDGGGDRDDLARLLGEHKQDGVSMLSALQRRLGSSLGPSVCHISLTSAGADRAYLLGVGTRAPVLLLTQTVARDGKPLYVAKCLVRREAAHLTVIQG